MSDEFDEAAARGRFPAGLFQPAGSYRFSVDALLLAGFAAHRTEGAARFFDLGTGCGIVGLTLLLLNRNIEYGQGIDCNPELVRAAVHNAGLLGLSARFLPHAGDLADARFLHRLKAAASADLVLANPPWRLLGSGRLPATPARQQALFGNQRTLPLFASAAAFLLREGRRFACILSPDRVPDMLVAMADAGLTPSMLLSIHEKQARPSCFTLIEARKHSPLAPLIETRLVLRDAKGFPTPEALEFCPFLR